MGSVKCGVYNFEKERFCSFPHRYCEARGKTETQEDTCGSLKMSISCETSSNFDMVTTLKSKSFVASPIDTAKSETSEQGKITHVGAWKRACRARLSPSVTLRQLSKSKGFGASPINISKSELS